MLSQYLTIARTTDVRPGTMVRVQVNGTPVVLANVQGRYYAFDAECTHRGGFLDEGELAGTVVTCPVHGAQFEVTTGEAVELPATEPLVTYEVQVDREEIRIAWP